MTSGGIASVAAAGGQPARRGWTDSATTGAPAAAVAAVQQQEEGQTDAPHAAGAPRAGEDMTAEAAADAARVAATAGVATIAATVALALARALGGAAVAVAPLLPVGATAPAVRGRSRSRSPLDRRGLVAPPGMYRRDDRREARSRSRGRRGGATPQQHWRR